MGLKERIKISFLAHTRFKITIKKVLDLQV